DRARVWVFGGDFLKSATLKPEVFQHIIVPAHQRDRLDHLFESDILKARSALLYEKAGGSARRRDDGFFVAGSDEADRVIDRNVITNHIASGRNLHQPV